jgi:hypothetical protein
MRPAKLSGGDLSQGSKCLERKSDRRNALHGLVINLNSPEPFHAVHLSYATLSHPEAADARIDRENGSKA